MWNREVLKIRLSRGDFPGALNRYENHKCIMNPTSTVVWFSPAKNAEGKVALARECITKVME